MSDTETLLVRVQGPDRPGLLAGILRVLSEADAEVQDVEQIVIRRRLTLGIVVGVPEGHDLVKDLLLFGWEQEIEIDFEPVEASHTERDLGVIVTVVGPTVSPRSLEQVSGAISSVGGNVERIIRVARYPVLAYELLVSGAEMADLRRTLLSAAHHAPFDISVQQEGLGRRSKRLVVMDVDNTLIMDEAIELLAAKAGHGTAVQELTARAMAGEMDFEESLRARVAMLEGLTTEQIRAACTEMRLTPGARTFVRTLKRMGFIVVIVSGGFTDFTDLLKAELDLDHAFANQLEIVDGIATGNLVGRIVDRARKAELLEQVAESEGIPINQTVAVGDGANDLDMLATAGLGVAFNAKPVVRDAADTALSVPYLDAILFMLGIRRNEVEAADADDPDLATS